MDHTLAFSNAGQDWPYHIAADGSIKRLKAGGVMLGMFEEFTFEDDKVPLTTGDLLVIHSDGVTEAMNPMEDHFGEPRLQELIMEHRHLAAAEIIDTIITDVRKHAGVYPQSDDITIMVIKRL